MKNIEVTEQTFDRLFAPAMHIKNEEKETHVIEHFYNKELDQRGKRVFNYVSSSVWQYYLIDINA